MQREWYAARSKEIIDLTYGKLRGKYSIRIDDYPHPRAAAELPSSDIARCHAAAMIWRLLHLALVAWIAYLPQGANAHEVRPGYLELQQTAPESWSVLWKVPANGDLRLAIYPQFPTTCSPPADRVTFQNAGAYIERTSIVCKGGLAGREIVVNGLAATMTDVLVVGAHRRLGAGRATVTVNPAFMVETSPGAAAVLVPTRCWAWSTSCEASITYCSFSR